MTLEALTADELRHAYTTERDPQRRRTIRRLLNTPPTPPVAEPVAQQLKPGWERRVIQRLPPTTRPWTLEQIARAVDDERGGK
jgi:hypothetical protein